VRGWALTVGFGGGVRFRAQGLGGSDDLGLGGRFGLRASGSLKLQCRLGDRGCVRVPERAGPPLLNGFLATALLALLRQKVRILNRLLGFGLRLHQCDIEGAFGCRRFLPRYIETDCQQDEGMEGQCHNEREP